MRVLVPLLLSVWAFGSTVSADWVLEDAAWFSELTATFPLLSPRGLTAWTWQWTETVTEARVLSLVLHCVVSGLAAVLAYLLGLSVMGAWVAGVLLLLHPLAVESVTYAASRSELVSALGVVSGCLLAVLLRQWWRWPLIGLCVLVAVLGKESGIVLLALVPLMLYATGQPWLMSAGVAYLIAVIGAMGYYRGGLDILAHRGDYAQDIQVLDWMQMQSVAVWHMVYVTITTTGMTPDVDYDRIPMAGRLLSLLSLGIVALVAGVASIAWRSPAGIGVLFMLMAVSPRFVVQTPTSYLNEHQFYTPRIGLFMACAAALVFVGERAQQCVIITRRGHYGPEIT